MDIDLKNRKVVITGVSEGIGRSLALAFGEAGAKVAGSARNSERLHAIESEISGAGHFFCSADFSKSDDIQRFFNETDSRVSTNRDHGRTSPRWWNGERDSRNFG